ncbi:uncharacterized protein LOC127279028 [Leptopilina boulardi]|uniref:uncharacterized protein LOC127279028 n=1 Tax=Leptopilina boulardi TaxID=63433 RepID=UPI0021F689A6|nr:uncharacterized protein LOC127279028 [Leptopilina boulardi]
MDSERWPYAVVLFEDGYMIVNTNWGIFHEDTMVSCYFPYHLTKTEIHRLLKNLSDVNYKEWVDKNGHPFEVVKFCCYAMTFEMAQKKLELHIELSDVSTDELKNYEKLKKSRNKRKMTEKMAELVNKKKFCGEINTRQLVIPNASESSQIAQVNSNAVNEGELNTTPSDSEEVSINDNENAGNFGSDSAHIDSIITQTAASLESAFDISQSAFEEKILNALKKSTAVVLKGLHSVSLKVDTKKSNDETEDSPSFSNKDDDLKSFPIPDAAEMNRVEDKLKSKRFFNKVVSSIVKLGKSRTTSMTVTNILNNLLTFKAGQLFTLKGMGKVTPKPPFDQLRIYIVIQEAMRKMDKTSTVEDTAECIGKWLQQCSNRQKRLEEKLEKGEAAHNLQITFEEDDD